jgi:cytochrome c peroxidase
MWRKFFLILILLGFWAGAASAQRDLMSRSKALFQPIPEKPPTLKDNNPLTPDKIELGRMLYFDPRLSASNLISCNTCHNMGLGGADLQETSIGHGWQKGPRNAPTTFNAVFNIAQFWDGRAKDLAEQAKGPVQASVEMHNKPEEVVKTLMSLPEYRAKFASVFPGEKEALTFDNMAKAIEAFEATLLTPDSPFDRYLKGDDSALSDKEKRGLMLFMDKGCANCHNGVNVGGMGYFPFGVKEAPPAEVRPPGDKGRFKVTSTAADQYVFRAPALRNVAITMPYFHSGKVWKLEEAVAIMGSAQLGIQLSGEESGDITAFLDTLTGKQPREEYPILPPNTVSTPHPVLK